MLRSVQWAAANGRSHSGFFLFRTPRLFGSLDQQTPHFRLELELHGPGQARFRVAGANPLQNAAPGSSSSATVTEQEGAGLALRTLWWYGLRPSSRLRLQKYLIGLKPRKGRASSGGPGGRAEASLLIGPAGD